MPYYRVVSLRERSPFLPEDFKGRLASALYPYPPYGGYSLKKIGKKDAWKVIRSWVEGEEEYIVYHRHGMFTCSCSDGVDWCEHKLFVLTRINVPEDMMTILLLLEPRFGHYFKPTPFWLLVLVRMWRSILLDLEGFLFR